MAGGNRYKHRSLGGGLVPNNQQAPSNNFYVAPTKRDYLAEALALAQAGLQGTAEAGLTGIGEALSNPTKSLAALLTPGSGALAVNDALAKPAADQLVRDWGGVKPAMQAGSDVMALADILSGKEKSVPFAPVYAGQKASDALVNAGTAALDASTFLPAGVARSKFDDVPSLSKFDEFATALDAKNAAAMADNSSMGVGSMAQMPRSGGPSFGRDETRVARVMASQNANKLTPPTGPKPLGFDDWSPEWKAAYDKGLDMSTEARMARAREQGFNVDEPLYRGQESDFTPSGGVYASTDPEMASLYARGQGGMGYPLVARGNMKPLPDTPVGSETMEGLGFDGGINVRAQISGEGFDGASYADQRYILDPANVRSPSAAFDPDNIGKPSMLGMGFPFGGKDGEKPLLSALMDAFKGKPKESPLDQFTPPKSLDDIFTGGGPRAPREITGGAENPAGLEGGFMHDPRFNGPQQPVPYNPESGFGGLDARLGKPKGDPTILGMGAPFEGKAKGIKAYHGSPHDFDRFDMSKIGTGEGAQAYGHGLYFAENEAVAKQYRDQLARDFFKTEDGLFNPSSLEHLNVRVPASRGELDNAIERARFIVSSPSSPEATRAMAARDLKTLEEIKAKGGIQPHEGHMYEANINADPNSFLDLDQPFYGQSESVQDAIGGLVDKPNEYYDLNTLLQNGVGRFKTPAQTSETLRNAGIPGAKYLDQNSRNAGGWHITPPEQTTSGKWMVKSSDYNSKGLQFDTKAAAEKALAEKLASDTRNYVVFDDKLVDINRKYMGVPADDLIKLLMAYGAFGGMSAGALATMDAQKHQQGGM